jgi:hypothetical protein
MAIAELENLIADHGELAGDGVEGELMRGAGGTAGCVRGGGPWGVAALGRAAGCLLPASVLFVQTAAWGTYEEREERRKKKEENEGKEKKEKEEKNVEIFPNLKILGRKIKDNLSSWSKNYYFLKKGICLIINK